MAKIRGQRSSPLGSFNPQQLATIYDRDPHSGAFIIDVALGCYGDLFNS
jgi:hypothetical protein